MKKDDELYGALAILLKRKRNKRNIKIKNKLPVILIVISFGWIIWGFTGLPIDSYPPFKQILLIGIGLLLFTIGFWLFANWEFRWD